MFNHSKSSLQNFATCKYKFYLNTIAKEEAAVPSIMSMGTRLHSLYEVFFYPDKAGGINKDTLWLTDAFSDYGTTRSQIFLYFQSVLFNLLTEKELDNDYYITRIRSFSNFQAIRWADIKMHFKTKDESISYFFPTNLEKEMIFHHTDFRHPFKGIIDAEFVGQEKRIIVDYKTGKIPVPVLNEAKRDPNKLYSSKLPYSYVAEGNFYVMLYLLAHGHKLIFDGTQYKFQGVNDLKWVDYMFVFTSGEGVCVSRKKASLQTIQTILEKIKKIEEFEKQVESGVETWKREPNDYVCPNCQFFLEYCAAYVENAEFYKSLIKPDIYKEDLDETEPDSAGKEG